MRATSLLRTILRLKKTRILDVVPQDGRLVVEVAPSTRLPRCSGCGCRARRIYDRRQRTWRHLDVGELMVVLRYDLRRVDCRSCGVCTELVPWAAPGSRFTWEFEQLVGYLAQNASKTAVSALVRIAWETVGSIAARLVDRLRPGDVMDDLVDIGIDELSYRKHHQYITLVVDHRRGRVVWAYPGKSAETLGRFFEALGAERAGKLERVSIDMSAAYENAVRAAAPQAQIVFDRFHVQRLVHDALDEVRRSEVRATIEPRAAKAIKKTRWALQKRPWNLTAPQQTKLAAVQCANRRLFRGYLLKETLAAILDGDEGDPAVQLPAWIRWARRSRLKPFARAAATIRDRLGGILAYCNSGISNARVEALNGKARTITRRSYGFHGPNSLIALLFLCCGGIRLTPPHAVHP